MESPSRVQLESYYNTIGSFLCIAASSMPIRVVTREVRYIHELSLTLEHFMPIISRAAPGLTGFVCALISNLIPRSLKHTASIGLWYPKGASFTLLGYSDSDFAGCRVDHKSTSGVCHLLGRSLVSWSTKKQNFVALSTAEAEYIAVGACCAQILYMKQSLLDYGVELDRIPLLCDNKTAVKIANNPVQHSRTKHIDIHHHFLRDHVARNDISLCGVRSEDQLADIFTKPLDESTFCRLRSELNVLDASNVM